MASKSELRTWALDLPPPSPIESEAIAARVAAWLDTVPSGLVLVYLSMPGEIRAERVAELASAGHEFATTRTPPRGPLTIHPLSAKRERHRFGYEQPVADSPTIDPADLTVVLVPGLTFDEDGNRIGWGKGYYDRLLASTDAVRVGLTLERRVSVGIPVEPHDRAMDFLATESRLVSISGRSPSNR